MSFTDLTCSFGPLVAAAEDAELDGWSLILPFGVAVISTLWFAYLLRSTSPEDTTVQVFGADAELAAEPVGLISVRVNDFPSALGVRQPVTVCGLEDDWVAGAADGSVEGVCAGACALTNGAPASRADTPAANKTCLFIGFLHMIQPSNNAGVNTGRGRTGEPRTTVERNQGAYHRISTSALLQVRRFRSHEPTDAVKVTRPVNELPTFCAYSG
jgi:hypothetical protein